MPPPKTYTLIDELLDKRKLFSAVVHKVQLPDYMELKQLETEGRPVYSELTLPAHLRKPGNLSEIEPAIYPVKTKIVYGGYQVYFTTSPIMFKATVRQVGEKRKRDKRYLIDGQYFLDRFHGTSYEDEYGFPPFEVIEEIATLGKGDNKTVLKKVQRIDYEQQEYEREVIDVKTGETVEHILGFNVSLEWFKRLRDKEQLGR